MKDLQHITTLLSYQRNFTALAFRTHLNTTKPHNVLHYSVHKQIFSCCLVPSASRAIFRKLHDFKLNFWSVHEWNFSLVGLALA